MKNLTSANYNIHIIDHSFGGVLCAEAAKIINSSGSKANELTKLDNVRKPYNRQGRLSRWRCIKAIREMAAKIS